VWFKKKNVSLCTDLAIQLEPNGDLHLVDASSATMPAITNTWFISLVKFVLWKAFGIKSSSEKDHRQREDSDSEEYNSGTSTPKSGDEADGVSTNVSSRTGGGAKKLPTGKAGGMRRKNVRRPR